MSADSAVTNCKFSPSIYPSDGVPGGFGGPKKTIFPKFSEINIKPVMTLFFPESYVFEVQKLKKAI